MEHGPRRSPIYAIIRSGGKQYRVEEGSIIEVERLEANEGDKVELTDVLLLADDGRVTVGSATVPGAKVTAEVVSQGRGKKVTVFKYKSKTRQRTKTGHRQPYTRLAIQEIVTAEKRAQVKAEAKPTEETAERKPAAKSSQVKAEAKPTEETAERKPAAKRARVKAEAKPTEKTTESKPKRAPRRKATSHGT
jgi:large subunit ribosomal protein L21